MPGDRRRQFGGLLQGLLLALRIGLQASQLLRQIAALGAGLRAGQAFAPVRHLGSQLALPGLHALERGPGRLHGLLRGLRVVAQLGQRLGVMLVAPDLLGKQRQGLVGLRQLALQLLQGLAFARDAFQALARLRGPLGHCLPGLFALGSLILGAQPRQPVDVVVDLALGGGQRLALLAGPRPGFLGFLVGPLGLAAARIQQGGALGRHALEQAIAVGGGQLARHLGQRRAHVHAGMPGRREQGLSFALLDPQQARHSCVLGPAQAAARELVAQQPRQQVLGFLAFMALRAAVDQQLAARAVQELLAQRIRVAVVREIHRHRGPRVRHVPGRQVGQRLVGGVAFQERGAQGRDEGALARLVGTHDDVQAAIQVFQRDWLAEFAKRLQGDAAQLHEAPSASSRWYCSSSRSATRAAAACAPSPCMACRRAAAAPT
ncbi:Uncharacterised protein [Bordetella pertussis]|nr:Uncharacterised protein [Bordetella pertussis]CFL84279.1 Uncharacterised protein [Bordetella pertussis]CFM20796.1 Uncharacterised protein [Bordetella pertussis]CFM86372.1 Uncharacterised protein [Bordetella pertussis]CFN27191.1 Uncharacterised protein [Bordetella pertussis]